MAEVELRAAPPRRAPRRLPTSAQVLVATAAGTALMLLLAVLPWTDRFATTASMLVTLALVVVLGLACGRRPDRAPWLLVCAGLVVALAVRLVSAVAAGSPTAPMLSLAVYRDHPALLAAGLAGYLLVYLGQARLLVESLDGTAAGAWLDGLMADVVAVAVAVAAVAPALAPLGVSQLGVLALVGRVAGSLLLVWLAVTAVRLRGPARDPRLDLMAVGSTAFFLSDLVGVLSVVGVLPPSTAAVLAVGSLRLAAAGLLTAAALAPAPARVLIRVPTRAVALVSAGTLLGACALLATDRLLGLPGLSVGLALACVAGAGVRLLGLTREVSDLLGHRRLALVDDLTDLLNRRGLRVEAARALEAPPAGLTHDEQRGTSLLLVDLAAFKEVNARFGQVTGDEVLRVTAERLRLLAGGQRVLARLGGDEFALLAPATDEPTGVALAERAAAAVTAPIAASGHLVRLGTSVGVAHATAGSAPEELLRRAALALHRAKASGGGVQRFDADVDAAARHRVRLLDDLRAALAEPLLPGAPGQVVAHYQPQVDADGSVSGVEALARWDHPELGLLQPSAFIDLAEEHGLLPSITERVLHQAVAQAAHWHREGRALRVAVNLSASCLDWPRLLDVVDEVLAARVLPPELLVLEVTETGLVSGSARGLDVAHRLVERGVELSIDDYGTGYSSLAHLDRLPASELKLDRAFTARLLEDHRTARIVRATVDLAHDLGMRLVAEGVEDEATQRALTEIGCDVTQGYWHSRPLPADRLSTWLAERAGAPEVQPAR